MGRSSFRTWFITGTSKGLGLATARMALAQGDAVVATARDPDRVRASLGTVSRRLLTVPLDVTDERQASAAVEEAVARFGRIDVLVNNAGRGLLGAVEEASADEVAAVFATNVFGLLTATRAVLPVMRRQRSGRVINISSVGGFRGSAGWGHYNATKFAVEGLSEAMALELAPLGIAVIVIEPGLFRTDFLDASSLHRTARILDDYAATVGGTRTRAEAINHNQVGDPVKAAAAIYTVAISAAPPLRLQLGADAVAAVEAKIARVTGELEQWRNLALATSRDDTSAPGGVTHGGAIRSNRESSLAVVVESKPVA
jgi:NAD(P)-dependent dehydrogenase (short-subunit alcohol dehydrogenase family)